MPDPIKFVEKEPLLADYLRSGRTLEQWVAAWNRWDGRRLARRMLKARAKSRVFRKREA